MTHAEAAVDVVTMRARADRLIADERWSAALPGVEEVGSWAGRLRNAGRLTLNLHPDRIDRWGRSVAQGLLMDGRYRSQWATGLSAGSRSAVPGGVRHRFEQALFGGAYDDANASDVEFPIYGSFDLVFDEHGGSPRFGSSFIVLDENVRERVTLCVGDSATGPRDVGTFEAPWSVLAGLAEQAAKSSLLNRQLGPEALMESLDGVYRSSKASRDLDGYIEVQVHGGVVLTDDVEGIVLDPSFRGTEIEADVTAAADRYGFDVGWHCGSELRAEQVPETFRGPSMPALAREVARADGVVDARAIGLKAARLRLEEPPLDGDAPESEIQQLKYLWHTLVAFGHDATSDG